MCHNTLSLYAMFYCLEFHAHIHSARNRLMINMKLSSAANRATQGQCVLVCATTPQSQHSTLPQGAHNRRCAGLCSPLRASKSDSTRGYIYIYIYIYPRLESYQSKELTTFRDHSPSFAKGLGMDR